MKKFLLTILLFVFIIFSSALAEENIKEETQITANTTEISTEEWLNQLLETAKYFDKRYPKEKIHEDMREDIKKAFPGISEQQAYDLQISIREGLGVYRYFKNIHDQYMTKLLTPEEPAIIVDDDQIVSYEQNQDYMESNEDAVIISDIKTIVPYALTQRDRKALDAKIINDAKKTDKKGDFDELVNIVARIKLKELPFYDVLYPSPLTGKKGLGEWQREKDAHVRIITEQTGVKDIKNIKGIIHFALPDSKMIIGIDGLYNRPKISFDKSENLKNWKVSIPLPVRVLTENKKDYSGFFKELAIPVDFEVIATEKPLILKAEIETNICNNKFECSTQKFNPELTLNSEYTRESSVATFVYQQHMNKPLEKSDKLNIESIKIKKLPQINEFIELIFNSTEKVSDFDVFISSSDNIAFETPRINIDGKKITVRFLPLDSNEKLENHTFEFSAILNSKTIIRNQIAPKIDEQPYEKQQLSWELIILGFIGGLLLNLMPCVFPVLSIKLLSLTKFGARRDDNVRRNFYYTIIGIFVSMLIIASFLALLKYIGYNIGWGMQFQNPYFVITMIFIVMLFILIVADIVKFSSPKWLQKYLATSTSDNSFHLLTGVMVVMMSTPCTAPYLGTTIGFALAGSITDIYCILTAVALGLASPYILMYLFPQMIIIVPAPGAWMQKLNRIMILMLIITICWLLSILQAQTNVWFIVRLTVYIIISIIVLWLNCLNNDNYYEGFSSQEQDVIKRKFNILFISIVTILYAVALTDGWYNYKRHLQEVQKHTVENVSMQEINDYLKEGKTVIVAVGADWCLTCKYNDITVFQKPTLAERIKNKNIKFIKVDWTNYNKDVLSFMKQYKRSGLPFYILFSPLVPDGVVLPEILDDIYLNNLITNFSIRQPEPL